MPKHLGKVAFLISKPLQLMVALCIVKQAEWETKPVFIILDSFSGAKEVAGKLLHEFGQTQSPVYFTCRQAVFAYVKEEKFEHLFIDSDVGLKNLQILALQKIANPQLAIHVYEEGVGTYRTDLYHGLKKKTFSLLGVGTYFGGSCLVSSVYVFNVNEYICNFPSSSHKVKEIHGSLQDFLKKNSEALSRVFGFSWITTRAGGESLCFIYLCSWSISQAFLCCFTNLDGDLYVKPHPHSQEKITFGEIPVLSSGVPAELIILNLMEIYDVVTVFDHDSSARRYVSGESLSFKTAQVLSVKQHAVDLL